MSAPAAAGPADQPSEEIDQAILELESRRFKYQGAKERAIRTELGLAPTAYYQRLNGLLDSPRAWAPSPALLRRLRDHRDGGLS